MELGRQFAEVLHALDRREAGAPERIALFRGYYDTRELSKNVSG